MAERLEEKLKTKLEENYLQLMSQRKDNFPNIGVGHYSPKPISSLLSIFINQILLEHSHTHSFAYCLWLLLPCSSRIK